MSIKFAIAQSFFKEEIYRMKKELKNEIAECFREKIKEKDNIIKNKDNLIAELIKENQQLKINLNVENDKKKDKTNKLYPSNMID